MSAKRLKVLMSAYACEPGKGSEPGQGWQWACHMSRFVDLTVITRSNNRNRIEAAIRKTASDHSICKVNFEYHDLGKLMLLLKKHGVLWPYYFLWQIDVARKYRNLAEEQDIVHHVTFNSIACPGFWDCRNAAIVLGPIGAPLVPNGFFGIFRTKAIIQLIRNGVIRICGLLPPIRKTLKKATIIIPANHEVLQLIQKFGFQCEPPMTDAWPPTYETRPVQHETTRRGTRFFYFGRMERRKWVEIGIRAFSLGVQNGIIQPDSTLTILGDGPDREKLEALCKREPVISEKVFFKGSMPQAEAIQQINTLDVLLFTSIRDTSGNVILEAMSCAKPVICLNHQGATFLTEPCCSLQIDLYPKKNLLIRLSYAMGTLSWDVKRVGQMGIEAQNLVKQFHSPEVRVKHMLDLYQTALKRKNCVHEDPSGS